MQHCFSQLSSIGFFGWLVRVDQLTPHKKPQFQAWGWVASRIYEGWDALNVLYEHSSCQCDIVCSRSALTEVRFCRAMEQLSERVGFPLCDLKEQCCIPSIAGNWELRCGSLSWKQSLVLETFFSFLKASFNALKCLRAKPRLPGFVSFNVNVIDGRNQLFIFLLTTRIPQSDTNDADNGALETIWHIYHFLHRMSVLILTGGCCVSACNQSCCCLAWSAFGVSFPIDLNQGMQSLKGKKHWAAGNPNLPNTQ